MIPNVEFFFGIFWVGTKNHGLAAIVLVVLLGGGGKQKSWHNNVETLVSFHIFFFASERVGRWCRCSWIWRVGDEMQKSSYFPLYWLFDRDPYNGLWSNAHMTG